MMVHLHIFRVYHFETQRRVPILFMEHKLLQSLSNFFTPSVPTEDADDEWYEQMGPNDRHRPPPSQHDVREETSHRRSFRDMLLGRRAGDSRRLLPPLADTLILAQSQAMALAGVSPDRFPQRSPPRSPPALSPAYRSGN
jgi:hypothetical protein